MPSLTRREFVGRTALVAAAANLLRGTAGAATATPSQVESVRSPLSPAAAPLVWLDGSAPAAGTPGVTLGVPWPTGQHAAGTRFAVRGSGGRAVPAQTWSLASWPDGSVKWTGVALPPEAADGADLEIAAGDPVGPAQPLTVRETAEEIELDTGVVQYRLRKSGDVLIADVRRGGQEILKAGRLVCLREDRTDASAPRVEPFAGRLDKVSVEQAGPVRAVIKLEGRHAAAGEADGRRWLPFVVRLYAYAGSDALRVLHTIIYDGDEYRDFVRGLGLRFDVPLRGEAHDRHVRFAGEAGGVFTEAVRGLTGLRRDPGAAVRAAQRSGQATPSIDTWPATVSRRLDKIPAFSDWTLLQGTADGFEIRKRTKDGYTWLSAARGQRAGGLGYVGTPTGGVAFGLRNFWQSYPAQLDIRGATTEAAEVTVWMWAPDAGAMDLRGYHDGMGMDTYAEQLEGLEITYEDYEPGFDKPEGVARTSELFLWSLAGTPDGARLAGLAAAVATPAVLLARGDHVHRCGVFGGLWTPEDRSTPARAELAERLDQHFRFFVDQREQRRWYGYWNYGDVMHSYDADRHEWKYDIGGFAWDNSELSTDIWLWLYFLQTGRADVFRFAEAMTRHTGEVDVHHIGRFAPLGSRHSVLHWGCSAKQLRISTAANRRYYYYLTADERVGDLMREQNDGAAALVRIIAERKLIGTRQGGRAPEPIPEGFARLGFGTDWGSVAAAWLTEWERTGDPRVLARLRTSMRTIGEQPKGFFTQVSFMNLETGEFRRSTSDRASASHLSAVFGLIEVCSELVQLIDEPAFTQAWLDYCELYNAPAAEQTARLGNALGGLNLQQGHARLTAFAAKAKRDPALAQRAWREFFAGNGGMGDRGRFTTVRVAGPAVLRPVDEAARVSTNSSAQWGLAAIQCLALVGDTLPEA